ncbi:hypothetical protein VCX44_21735 [Aeromonas caviae]|uniref:Uncharacterized protein n=1 Tax=Aeromonas caviae TaxID=648 RepID=A0ABU5WEC3_AERCA|nr:hypothetical protein [Aeromonas caviae]MEA9438352.1 hypothetical protein [Aeromonas caviae]
MAGLWYRVGTVTLTNGSKAVVGYGTKWKSANPLPGKGSMLCGPDGKVYEVDTVADDTNMTLVSNYTGTSGAGQGYALVLMALTIPQFSTQLSQFVQKNSLFASQINTLLTATGDVNLTDPDSGLVIKVPSWSKIASEGEGQAARAKVEADKAAGSAAAAAAAVLAARLPTPDVSIPFTTDGRMTHGKGVPVLVGTIPVAQLVNYERLGSQTMIDKSGRLVTVPAGELAIEQQGLAIFDQSVNLFAPSINWAASANAAAAWTHGAVDASGWIAVSGSGVPSKVEGSYKDAVVPVKDVPHTFSMDVLKTPGLNFRLRAYGATAALDVALTDTTATGSNVEETVRDMGSYWRIEVTRTFVSDTTRIFRFYPFGTNVGAAGAVTYRRVQLEAKPFATPYIENATSTQTTRTATTRCDIPWPGNMQPVADWQELTISLEFDTAGVPASTANHTIFTQGGGVAQHLMARFEPNSLLRFYRSAGATHQPTIVARRRYKMCYRINRNACDLFIDGVRIGGSITASPVASGFNDLLRFGYALTPDRCLNGHLRNINIWNSPLTDAQCVAASS